MQQFAATAKLGAYLEPVVKTAERANVLPHPAMKRFLSGIESEADREIEEMATEYDPDEFADAFENYDQTIEEQLLEEYENSDIDYEEDELTEEFMRKAA